MSANEVLPGDAEATALAKAEQWRRDRDALAAAQHRIARVPVLDLLWRRPWRSSSRPRWRSLPDVRAWLAAAHDCADPSVGCSCAGGYRYPAGSTGEVSS